MSFILDALKKLEREKESARPGMVMVGPVAWGGRDRRGRGRLLVAAGVALAAIVALGGWWLGAGQGPTPGPPGETAGSPPEGPAAPARPASTVPELPIQPPSAGPPVMVPPARATENLPPGTPARLPEPPRAPPPSAEEAVSSPALAAVEPATPGDEAAAEPETETLDEPPVVAEEQAPQPEFRLTAISERDGAPIALLNDRLVHEGDRFGDILVVRISETEVEIEVDGERRVIGF